MLPAIITNSSLHETPIKMVEVFEAVVYVGVLIQGANISLVDLSGTYSMTFHRRSRSEFAFKPELLISMKRRLRRKQRTRLIKGIATVSGLSNKSFHVFRIRFRG